MNSGDKVAIVCCSNGIPEVHKDKIKQLEKVFMEIGLVPVFSEFLYARAASVFSGTARERAHCLMRFYKDDEVKAIFDVGGGDIANEILPYLDFEVIANSKKMFWGYSDLTTIVNAIYAKTGEKSVLYQVRNMVSRDSEKQILDFANTVMDENVAAKGKQDLFKLEYSFVQKQKMQGIVVGGNIRCLLKLAGTEYWPDMSRKILLLESRSGKVPQMVTFLNQLKQMGVFGKISGILLGTFTEMEKEGCMPPIEELVQVYAGTDIPIACTRNIGHGTDAKGIVIGGYLKLEQM